MAETKRSRVPVTYWEENRRDAIDRKCKESNGDQMRAVLSPVPKDFALTAEEDETQQYLQSRPIERVSDVGLEVEKQL